MINKVKAPIQTYNISKIVLLTYLKQIQAEGISSSEERIMIGMAR